MFTGRAVGRLDYTAPGAGVSVGSLAILSANHQESAASPRSGLMAKMVFIGKSIGRRLRWLPHDIRCRLKQGSGPPTPPLGISYVGHGDSGEVGQWYLGRFRSLGGLEPDDRVLDIGCGIGRMALPLMDYLDAGTYEGFDTSRGMVKWCQRNISSRDPRFTFRVASIHNQKYNPFGRIRASEYVFPYEDGAFDFVFATSVFTHLGIIDARHYLAEVGRVLSPSGVAFLTLFLLREEDHTADGPPAFDFSHEFGPLRTIDRREPEAAVAWPEGLLLGEARSAGLELEEPIAYGCWPGRAVGPDIQDIVVLRHRE
jgi:SAM-dependent methyltransferase